jgi:hypothetical protein
MAREEVIAKIMTRILKTFFGVMAFACLGLLAPAAHADSVSGSNDTTGANSDNSNSTTVNNQVTVNENNNSNTSNNVHITANTGNNSSNENTVGGSITTGDITGNLAIHNLSNSGSSSSNWTLGMGSFNVNGSNSLTGANSNNENNTNLSQNSRFNFANESRIANNVGLNANTGNNHSNRNTVGGSINTGDINFNVDINNVANPGRGGSSGSPSVPLASASLGGAVLSAMTIGKGAGAATLPVAGSSSLVFSLLLALIATLGIAQSRRFRQSEERLE